MPATPPPLPKMPPPLPPSPRPRSNTGALAIGIAAAVVLPTVAVIVFGAVGSGPGASAPSATVVVAPVPATTKPVESIADAKPRAVPATAPATTTPHDVQPEPTTPPEATSSLPADFAAAVRAGVSRRAYQCTPIEGGAFAQFPFQDVHPEGLLIGFRIGLGKFVKNDTIVFVQPIYLTPDGEQLGAGYGKNVEHVTRVVAPPGYAVGAASINGGGGLDSMTITYMRITSGNRLDPRDAYITPRVGGSGGGGAAYVGGDGTPIIGICGRYGEKRQYLGLGLVFLHATPVAKPH